MTVLPVDTPHGQANAHLHLADDPRAALVLGHGAGGGVTAPDLVAATSVARSEGVSVALVEQPYRVAGRRAPAPARQLDAAWTAVVGYLVARRAARVAGPRRRPVPGRAGGLPDGGDDRRGRGDLPRIPAAAAAPVRGRPSQSRLDELDALTVPSLVVQGVRDPFGMPPDSALRTVVQVPGNHSLRTDLEAVAAAVRGWLPGIVSEVVQTATRG